jgi:hypothetical protein
MAADGSKNRGWRQVRLAAIVIPFVTGIGLIGECAASGQITPTILAYLVGFSQPRLVPLQPGLRIEKKAPKGWTHLVIKSLPKLASGDRGTLPAGSAKTAALFRNVLLANVKPVDMSEKDFELTQVGLGICVPNPQNDAEDIVVTADRLEALGLNHLTMVQRMVLDAAEAEMAEGRIIARTPTFALFRSPVTMVDAGGKHTKLYLNYAFCVERTTGKLHVGVWPMRPSNEPQQVPLSIVKLATDAVFQCELDVHAKRILGTVPYSWSFAMRALPPGQKMRVSPELGRLIVATSRHPAESDPDELERLLLTSLVPASTANVAGNHRDAPPLADRAVRRTAIPPPYRKPQ